MLAIPPELQAQFDAHLRRKPVPNSLHGYYKKWLQYYLDFCHKYDILHRNKESLPRFIRKLQEKKQTKSQQEQAVKAINIYYEIVRSEPEITPANPVKRLQGRTAYTPPKQYPVLETSEKALQYKKVGPSHCHDAAPSTSLPNFSGAGKLAGETEIKPETGVSWKDQFFSLEEEIKLRHYSSSTLRSYKGWVSKFQTFTRSKRPEMLGPDDVKEFLTFLAVNQKVAATTQNQAFNGLLFFFRHVLHKEFGQIDGVVRAKRKPYIPVVLSREEIDTVLNHLEKPYDLVVKLLYGCGLRLSESLNLRVHCMNFDAGILSAPEKKFYPTMHPCFMSPSDGLQLKNPRNRTAIPVAFHPQIVQI